MPMNMNMGRGRTIVLATMLALVAGAFPASASAGGPTPPGECATVMPKDQIEAGMLGRGWTVARGGTPERFRVEVLGILPHGIAPGKDMIVVEVSDVSGSTIIEDAGGIWAGMSGSPVYVNGQLIGAVAYGLSGSTSPVGGVTPATDMLKVLDYGAPSLRSRPDATTVTLPAHLQRVVAARAGVPQAQARELERLAVPLAVSGLTPRGRQALQERMDRLGARVIVVRGARAATPTGGSGLETPVPGGNFSAVISYGDITAAGIGTTTYVCDDQALAFGHPMNWTGRTALGANDAQAIRIIADPTFGSYKLATVTDLFGTLDQDRLSAIRAALGDTPTTVPVTSQVRDLDTGNLRDGGSDVTADDFVPTIAANQLIANIDPTIDRIGGGSSRVRWIVTGERANGDPWSLDRVNRYADTFDISFASVDEMFSQLSQIDGNAFEDVTFDSVEIRATVESAVKLYDIETLRISKNGGPFRVRERMRVAPGDQLRLRVGLRLYRGGLQTRALSLTVPDDAQGDGFLAVTGGASAFDDCFIDPEACETGNGFVGLLESLENAPRNNDLIADLAFFGEDFDDIGPSARASTPLDRVVFGGIEISVFSGSEP